MTLLPIAAALLAAQAPAANAGPPGRDPSLLHRHLEQVVAEREQEREQSLRRLLALGGADDGQAEVAARLASLLRARGLALGTEAQASADRGEAEAAARASALAQAARKEAISLYRTMLSRWPRSPHQDEALFFLADTLQEAGSEAEAVLAAGELTRRFPQSPFAPDSHVFLGEHLFEQARLAEALAEYQAAAAVPSAEVYPYALYKAAWCRFNQGEFGDTMKLLHQVVEVSQNRASSSQGVGPAKVQLAREARRDYVVAYGRSGRCEAAREEFARVFGKQDGQHMLELYGRMLFDSGRDPEAQLVHRQLLELHGVGAAAVLDQTRLLLIASRSGKRVEVIREAAALVEAFRRAEAVAAPAPEEKEALSESRALAEQELRELAVRTHNEARKTSQEETFAAAKALYQDYLAIFPDSPEAYELRFFDAELLFGLGEKAAAAGLYEAVAQQDLAALRAKAKQGRWTEKAAYGAVLARDAVAQDEQPKKPETRAKPARAEARGPLPATGAALIAQRPLRAAEEALARACALYLDVLPEGARAVEVAYKLGRLEYLSGKLDSARERLAWIALKHPEHELAEVAANLVLDSANLQKDYAGLHQWAVRFLGDKKLTAHGTLLADLKRVEEESAYAVADGVQGDPAKARALLSFVDAHPRGALADKAIFGAAAALSRSGAPDAALEARSRLWKELPSSELVPRALLASADDRAALGDFGEAAGLLERYAAGFHRQEELRKWQREHKGQARASPAQAEPRFEEARAKTALQDAAVLREACGELRLALQDRNALLAQWRNAPDREELQQAAALLEARLGQPAKAARVLAALAKATQGKPGLTLLAWRDAARLFAKVRESDHATWSWNELEKGFKSLGSKAREKLTDEHLAAAAEAHLALGARTFEDYRRQRIEQPLVRTLARKVALLQQVKKRAEEVVAMREAEPAVCALGQLGEAQLLLAQGIAQSPAPAGLSGEQRKLYRAQLEEKAEPILAEAKDALRGTEAKARELGVIGPCALRVRAQLEKLGETTPGAGELPPPGPPLAPTPDFLSADGERQPLPPRGPASASTAAHIQTAAQVPAGETRPR